MCGGPFKAPERPDRSERPGSPERAVQARARLSDITSRHVHSRSSDRRPGRWSDARRSSMSATVDGTSVSTAGVSHSDTWCVYIAVARLGGSTSWLDSVVDTVARFSESTCDAFFANKYAFLFTYRALDSCLIAGQYLFACSIRHTYRVDLGKRHCAAHRHIDASAGGGAVGTCDPPGAVVGPHRDGEYLFCLLTRCFELDGSPPRLGREPCEGLRASGAGQGECVRGRGV